MASILCALVFPLDLISSATHWRSKKKRGTSSQKGGALQKSNTAKADNSNHKNPQTERSVSKNNTAERSRSIGSKSTKTQTVKKEMHTNEYTVSTAQQPDASTVNINYTSYECHLPKEEPVETVLDENIPKSKPKHEGDQYIRKRMIIAGSYYCNKTVLEQLRVGTYFDISPEHGDPHDKDAVILTYHGEKIGYVAKADKTPFVACLKLKRHIYGVITDIIVEDGKTKYEFETWFDQQF